MTTTNDESTNNKLALCSNFIIDGYKSSTVAYIITRQGMKNILDTILDQNIELYVADITIYKLAKKTCFLTKPYFIYHISSIINTTLHFESNLNYEDNNKIFWDKYYYTTTQNNSLCKLFWHSSFIIYPNIPAFCLHILCKIKNEFIIQGKIQQIMFKNKYNNKILIYIEKLANEYSIPLIKRILNVLAFYNIEYTTNMKEADIIFVHYNDNTNMFNTSSELNSLSILINGESHTDKNSICDIYIDSIKLEPNNYFHIYYPEIFQSSMSIISQNAQNMENKYKPKTKFCAYMYSYDINHRVNYFNLLSTYKHVDGLGKSMNNVKRNDDRFNTNFKDIAIELYSDYKFVLALENVLVDGYSTEKLLLPLFAHSIPIYYGSSKIFNYINKKRIIYIHDFKNDTDLLDYIKQIDNDDNLYNNIINEDWYINNNTFETLTNTLLDKQIINIFGISSSI